MAKQQKDEALIDSLSKIIQKTPNNYKAIEKRALLFFNKSFVRYPKTDEYKKYIDDLLLVILQDSACFESYKEVAQYYVFINEHDKAIKLWQI